MGSHKTPFEIKFVEAERRSINWVKDMSGSVNANSLVYSDEDLDTGVAEIDAIETAFANSIKLVMDAGGSGDFSVGEEIVGDQFRAFATATIDQRQTQSQLQMVVSTISLHCHLGCYYFRRRGSGATATAKQLLAAGIVTGISITSGGSGYTSAPICRD